MTDRIALYLGLALVGLIVLDLAVTGGDEILFVLRKIFVFIEFLAFWR
ncbi:hypothetical protein [Tabrizicola sp. TH137]|nr:hypothetical protein [Tabrizicola sp. TH137]